MLKKQALSPRNPAGALDPMLSGRQEINLGQIKYELDDSEIKSDGYDDKKITTIKKAHEDDQHEEISDAD